MNEEKKTAPGKCAECGGGGRIHRRVPAVAMAFPHNPEDWKWSDELCWRCKGDGKAYALGIDAPAVSRRPKEVDTPGELDIVP